MKCSITLHRLRRGQKTPDHNTSTCQLHLEGFNQMRSGALTRHRSHGQEVGRGGCVRLNCVRRGAKTTGGAATVASAARRTSLYIKVATAVMGFACADSMLAVSRARHRPAAVPFTLNAAPELVHHAAGHAHVPALMKGQKCNTQHHHRSSLTPLTQRSHWRSSLLL
jgi:hypothetical protein